MTDLDRLIRYEPDPESHYDIGVLSRAPIVHAQFEAVHPFVDGNGRIGGYPLMFVCDGGRPFLRESLSEAVVFTNPTHMANRTKASD